MYKRRDIAAQVHQGVEFYSTLGRTELSPGKHGQAQTDGGRIEGVDGVVEFDTKVFVYIKFVSDVNQGLGEVGVYAPVPCLTNHKGLQGGSYRQSSSSR